VRHTEGGNAALIRCDFYSAAGERLDVLPLSGTDVLGFNYSQFLDRTGAFSLSVAASSGSAVQVARQVWVHNDGEGYIFKGVIEEIQNQVSQDGSAILQGNGRSLAAKLAWKTTLLGRTFDNQTLSSVVSTLLTDSGFTAGEIASPLTNISTRFDGRSLWDALRFVAEVFGLSLREDNLNGEVDIAEFGTASAIVLKNLPSLSPNQASNLNIVPIRSIKKHTYALDIVNKVIPIAQQSGIAGSTVWFNLADSTRVSPYTIGSAVGPDSFTYYYIEDTDSQTAYGVREKVVQVKDILPLGVSTTDFERAANTLYDEAVTYLQRHKDEQAAYDVDVVGLTHISGSYRFQVGDTFRVQFEGTTDDLVTLSVDQDLYLMGFSRTFDSSGADTWKLTLSSILREIPDDGNRTAAFLRELEAVKAAPLPYVLIGDNDVRLSPLGIDYIALDSGDSVSESPNAAINRWFKDSFTGTPLAEIFGGYTTPGLDISQLILRALADGVDFGSVSMGVWAETTQVWLPILRMSNVLSDANPPFMIGTIDVDAPSTVEWLALRRTDADNFKLMIRQGGALVELGGGGAMETANTGQFLIPAGPANGNWVRSGAANAYGTWYPLPITDAVAPATPTESALNGSTNVLMPATIVAGDLLVAIVVRDDPNSTAFSTPAGWTLLGSSAGSSPTPGVGVWYKTADGTEDGTNVSFGANTGAAHVYRILAANWSGVPTISTVATGSGTTADPTSVTAPAGRFLAIAIAGVDQDSTVPTAAPSGYSGFTSHISGAGALGASIGTAYLIDSGASENPNAFTNGSNAWAAYVIAIAASNAVTEDTYVTDLALVPGGTPTYAQIQLGSGAAGAESAIGTLKLTDEGWEKTLQAVIPVTSGTRLSARMATDAAAADHFLTLGMLNQDDVA
jgi:hypothetical protein